MVKKLIFGFFVLIVLISFISATETQIIVKTLPEHRVHISVLRTGQVYSLIESFHKDSGTSGELTVTISTSEGNFNIGVWVKKDNVDIVSKKFEDEFPVGTPITLEVYPDWYAPPKKGPVLNETNSSNNQSSENITNESNLQAETNPEETDTNNSQLTGLVTSEKSSIFSKKTIYYTGGIIGFFIVSFVVFLFIKNRQPSTKEITIKKLSELKENKGDKIGYDLRIIEDAERKIKEAQEEINKLKNEEKIKELKNKVEDYQKEINRLEGGN